MWTFWKKIGNYYIVLYFMRNVVSPFEEKNLGDQIKVLFLEMFPFKIL